MKIEDILKNKIRIKKKKDFSGVYFLISKEKIVYVGTAENVKARMYSHKKNARMYFDSYYIMKIKDKKERNKIEIKYIRKLKPLYNFLYNPDYEEGKKDLFLLFLRKFKGVNEVAMLCGVSESSVIKVIHGKGNTSDEMKQRVIETLKSRGEVRKFLLPKEQENGILEKRD